jgi:hypothetical protein
MSRKRHGSFDFFEGFMMAMGVVFVALGGLCLFATVYLILTFGDRDPAFPASQTFQQVLKGLGIGMFGVGTFVMFGVSAHLLGDRTRRRWRSLFRRRRR